MQQLTQLFLGLATTLDFGRKLAWNYRFDKLGMNETLRKLEELQAGHQVDELSAIEPVLRKIANDSGLMHISRETAQHLLKTIGVAGAAGQSTPSLDSLHQNSQVLRAIFGNFTSHRCSNRCRQRRTRTRRVSKCAVLSQVQSSPEKLRSREYRYVTRVGLHCR